MFKAVSVLIPFKSDNGPREGAFKLVNDFYKNLMPEAEICIGKTNTEPFNKSKAINSAAEQATRKIFVIADADIVYAPEIIEHAIWLLKFTSWVIPFRKVINLTENNTKKIITNEFQWPMDCDLENNPQTILSFYGGINVLYRDKFEEIGGYDERFAGWGGEDNAFAFAMNTLFGKYTRLNYSVIHLWHPHIGASNNPNYNANIELFNCYISSNGEVDKMKRLIQEGMISKSKYK